MVRLVLLIALLPLSKGIQEAGSADCAALPSNEPSEDDLGLLQLRSSGQAPVAQASEALPGGAPCPPGQRPTATGKPPSSPPGWASSLGPIFANPNVTALVQQVENDPALQKLMASAHAYAQDMVRQNLDAIRANVKAIGIDVLDLLWPGDGYNEAAYGGQFEVLKLLEQEGVLKVGNAMGASGGASSTVLAFTDGNSSGQDILLYNLAYVVSGITPESQLFRETPFWSDAYRMALQAPGAFDRVKKSAWCSCLCAKIGGINTILHNFATVDQAVNAFYASGDASILGISIGTKIPGDPADGTCSDGGQPTYFPKSSASLLWFNAFFGDAFTVNVQGVSDLFHLGVNMTVAALKRQGMLLEDTAGVIAVVQPGPGGSVTNKEWQALRAQISGIRDPSTRFDDITAGNITTRDSR